MLEIEIKAKITDTGAVKAALCERGFLFLHTLLETDVYYSGTDRNFAKTDEALRLRTTENKVTGETAAALTYKGPKLGLGNVAKTRTEIEVGVADGARMQALLLALGHHPVRAVEKQRDYYTRETITACVDEVAGLGSYMELETLCETEDKAALEGLTAFLEQLGISRHACTEKSYLEMLLEKDGMA